MYGLEGFLTRLVASPYKGKLVLKGGVLLAAYDTRRPTRDVDLQGHHLTNDTEAVLEMVRNIAAIDVDDGLALDAAGASAETIRDDEIYSGARVTITGHLSVARLRFHVDVNVGDPIWPRPQTISLPRLLSGSIVLAGYPLPMVHAEKVLTAVQRGKANTRWRDFADIYTLTHRHDVDGHELASAATKVAAHRQVSFVPLRELLDGYAGQAQPQWSAWRRKHRLDDQLPQGFDAVLDVVIAFADPVLAGAVRDRVWNAARLRWESQLLSGGGFQGEVAAVGRVEEVDLVQVEPDLRRLALGHR
jgi:hypothetical protein